MRHANFVWQTYPSTIHTQRHNLPFLGKLCLFLAFFVLYCFNIYFGCETKCKSMITGSKIKMVRQLKNVSTKALADELNIDISSYLRIERGDVKLTEQKAEIILKTLGVSREFVEQLHTYAKV